MENLAKNTQVNFKTNAQHLKRAKSVFTRNNLTLTDAMNLFVDFVSSKNELPFQTEEEIRRAKLMAEFQAQVAKSMEDLKVGKGVGLDDARKRLLS